MKLKFKIQAYQTESVASVIDCFAGQLNTADIKHGTYHNKKYPLLETHHFKNAELQLSDTQLIENMYAVQRRQNLPLSDKLIQSVACKINLDIEMETGTGKTYCYLKTIFEMNQHYGWTKFIIVVPSIAIREGVSKSLESTADHFKEYYKNKIRFFIYNSKQLHQLENFSSDSGINVMIINIQAFNASGKDNRRIYEKLDDFQSRAPIDVISACNPILILDEPQKMEGDKTLEGLKKFNPLMMLRYSATHRAEHNKIYRLDALDAYNQKLVKKISVHGITHKGLAGNNAYLYLESIEISTRAPVARLEIEVLQKNGITRTLKRFKKGDNLASISKLDQYQGFIIADINAYHDTVEFTNGHVLNSGDAIGDVTELMMRRIQIREAIKAHIEKEQTLFSQGIKVLSLFFIDEVAKYRDYDQADTQGEYARMFEEEYEKTKTDYLTEHAEGNRAYQEYLQKISVNDTHQGYFSIDHKTKKWVDPSVKRRGENAGLSDDVDAYDLILKNKERLLSFAEPVRFIFSHSALREGWDNPNVFVIAMLKHSDNTISRRQEVGRGLRLCVNQQGDRMDHPATVHDINVLTVIANESYETFVECLQSEMKAFLSRPRIADKAYFLGKTLKIEKGNIIINDTMASDIEFYLIKQDYVDTKRNLTKKYYDDVKNETVAPFPDALKIHANEIITLINGLFSDNAIPSPDNGRAKKQNPLNDNFNKKEFKALWERINRKAIYQVDFDSNELIKHCVTTLNQSLKVTSLYFNIQKGEQREQTTYEQLVAGDGFCVKESSAKKYELFSHNKTPYDLIGKIATNTELTRKTIADILSNIEPTTFKQFQENPEQFILETSRLINEQKASMVIEHLSYDETHQTYDVDIFTAGQYIYNFQGLGQTLKKHIYDYVITDSNIEKQFATHLDASNEVVVYAKLPRGFLIPTPVGDYNPDWAISFKEGLVKHIYFVAETKGSMSTSNFRGYEKTKTDCARIFFEKLNQKINHETVKYDTVTTFDDLIKKADMHTLKGIV